MPCAIADALILPADSVVQDQLADLFVHRQDLKETEAAREAGEPAGAAPDAVFELGGDRGPDLLLHDQRHLGGRRTLFAAVRADAADQALGHDALDASWPPGTAPAPMSSRRVTAPAASLVCRVENTRWPVSAAWTAISAVSWSRISPTMMMSGSWRTIVRRPRENVRPIALPDLHLVDARQLVLDRVLDRDDLLLDVVDLAGARRRAWSSCREPVGPGDQEDPVRPRGSACWKMSSGPGGHAQLLQRRAAMLLWSRMRMTTASP